MRIETSVAEQDLTRFRQQLEGSRPPSAGDLVQATPAPTGYRRQAWARTAVALNVTVTCSWMAFFGYGLIDLIFSVLRMLG
jgi:hypothetical protein